MDSMQHRITLVLLLVICLPERWCSEILNCTEVNAGYSLQSSRCETSKGISWDKSESYVVNVAENPPVEIDFEFKLTSPVTGKNQSEAPYMGIYDDTCASTGRMEWQIEGGYHVSGKYNFTTSSLLMPPSAPSGNCDSPYMVIRFPEDSPAAAGPTAARIKTDGRGLDRVALAVGLAAGIAGILLVAFVVVMRRKVPWRKLSPMNSRNSKDGGSDLSSTNDLSDLEIGAPRHYSYKELSSATHSFSSKFVVGEGGFGTVYKGILKDTRSPVAIKRLSQYARQGAREFVAEVKIISQLRHRNLVQLLGWCLEKEELILVYEYMPNGDLDELIYADKPKCDLSWKQRYNILCGVATALVYLHEEWVQRVIHRDVKTSNVMLDSNLNARLGDFGLARLSAHSQAPQSTLVAGTLGYLAPEFSMSGKATDKTDVYSFGVVALEVTCARRPLSPNLILVDWVWELHKQDRLFDAVDPRLDPKLFSTDDEVRIKNVLQIALLCAHPDPNARPTMRHVLNIMTGQASLPRVPRSKPVASYFEDD